MMYRSAIWGMMSASPNDICFADFFKQSLKMVGPSGLEPPTSCLSGTRSNHLSYEPLCTVLFLRIVFWVMSFFEALWLLRKLSLHYVKVELFWVHGGDDGIRTHDPLLAGQVLSQLSYTPIILVMSASHTMNASRVISYDRFACF